MEYMHLKTKPDTEKAMKRLEAWLHHEMIERVPVQFHRQDMTRKIDRETSGWDSLKDRWFDSEYQVDRYIRSIEGRNFLAESFPVFWPNLGPDLYAAFFGIELDYTEESSYAIHSQDSLEDLGNSLGFSRENTYFKKIEEMTRLAIEMSEGRYFVGFTDLQPGIDTVAAWRNPETLCMDLIMDPEGVKALIKKATMDFQQVYDHFHDLLKKNDQPSVNWMEIPTLGKFLTPSCDFSSLISTEHFEEYALPFIQEQVKPMDHVVFHLDGPGMVRHLDPILSIPEIDAIQWVQGAGDNNLIGQWKPLIRKIQSAGRSVMVYLQPGELDDFMSDMKPGGIMLCIPSSGEEAERAMLKQISKWVR